MLPCGEGDTHVDGRDASPESRPRRHGTSEPAGDDGRVLHESLDVKSEGEGPDDESDDLEDEFADHSDAEFGALPESVFEAIEDTRDGLPTADDPASPPPEPDPAPAAPPGEPTSRRRPRACPVCSKVYTAPSSYFYHVKYSHRETKEHECEVCGRRFGTAASLRQHAPIHTGERRYECPECSRRFGSRASLYNHRLTHDSDRKWACAQCGRGFGSRCGLVRHVARHAGAEGAGERRHACGTCARTFAVRCDLVRHARTHSRPHPDDRYACHQCHLKFAQPRYLKVHIKKKHS